jgi:hypothetical protein
LNVDGRAVAEMAMRGQFKTIAPLSVIISADVASNLAGIVFPFENPRGNNLAVLLGPQCPRLHCRVGCETLDRHVAPSIAGKLRQELGVKCPYFGDGARHRH